MQLAVKMKDKRLKTARGRQEEQWKVETTTKIRAFRYLSFVLVLTARCKLPAAS